MPFNAVCLKLPPIALVITLISLSACATGGSDVPGVDVCPPVVDYDQAFRERAAAELELLPDGSAMERIMQDFHVVRGQKRACLTR